MSHHLEALFARAAEDDERAMNILGRYAEDVGYADEASEALELVDVKQTIGGDDGREELTRSEPADFGGGESTGVQKP